MAADSPAVLGFIEAHGRRRPVEGPSRLLVSQERRRPPEARHDAGNASVGRCGAKHAETAPAGSREGMSSVSAASTGEEATLYDRLGRTKQWFAADHRSRGRGWSEADRLAITGVIASRRAGEPNLAHSGGDAQVVPSRARISRNSPTNAQLFDYTRDSAIWGAQQASLAASLPRPVAHPAWSSARDNAFAETRAAPGVRAGTRRDTLPRRYSRR